MSARFLVLIVALIANAVDAETLFGQQAQPDQFDVPIHRASAEQGDDQLPASRSFPPAAANDLRIPRSSADQPVNQNKSAAPKQAARLIQQPASQQQPAQTSPTIGQFQSRDARFHDASEAPARDAQIQNSPWSLENQLSGEKENTVLEQPNLPVLDDSVRATGYSGTAPIQTGNGNPVAVSSQAARQILSRFELASVADPLPGMPLRLQDALMQTMPQSRREMVKHYWAAFGAWADYLSCADYLQKMNQIPQTNNRVDQGLFENARQLAENDLLEAEMRLTQAQTMLQGFFRNSASDELLPLPADLPLAQQYDTHFDWYATNRQLSGSLKSIDLSLPKMLKLISNRADAIWSSESAYEMTFQGYTARQAALSTLLQAAEISKANVDSFVRTIVEYNQSIAEYSLSVTPVNQPVEAMVTMFVAPPRAVDLNVAEPMVREASLPRELQRSDDFSTGMARSQNPSLDSVPTRVASGQPTFQQPTRPNPSSRGNEVSPLTPNPSSRLQPNSTGIPNSPAKQPTGNQFNFGG